MKCHLLFFATIGLMGGCSTLIPPHAITPELLKADGKRSYFVLASEYEIVLQKITDSNTIENYNYPAAVYTIEGYREGEAKPKAHQYDYKPSQRIYQIHPSENLLQLKRIGTLQVVKRYERYQCRQVGQPNGKMGSFQQCGYITSYQPIYSWRELADTPKLSVTQAAIHLYGKPDLTDPNSSTNTFLNSVRQKSQEIKLPVVGY